MTEFRVVEQNPFVMYRARFTRKDGAPIKSTDGWVYLDWSAEGGGFWSVREWEVRFFDGNSKRKKPKDVVSAFKAAGPWWYAVDLETIETCRGARQIHQSNWASLEPTNRTRTEREGVQDDVQDATSETNGSS